MKYIVLFFIIVIGFAYFAKIRIPLPNGYILEGKYFDFGEQIIAVNMIGTDMQDRNNGLTNWAGSKETLFKN